VTWIVVGAALSGFIGIGITYISGAFTPKAKFKVDVSGPWPEHPLQPGSWDRVDLTLENVSKRAQGSEVTVRILATSPPVKYAPKESKLFFRMVPDNLCHKEDESESYAYDVGNDPKTFQVHDMTVLCNNIYPEEQRHFGIQFRPPEDQSDEAPNAPSAISVSVKYVGYSLELRFKPKGGAPCGVARKYGGRFSQEECYIGERTSDN
jgi:hypothetical protein